MNKEIKNICADCSRVKNHIFSIDSSSHYLNDDCHDNCIVWNNINLYGVPFDFDDERMDQIYEGKYSNTFKIGEISGCLIMCKKLIEMGEDPWQICDDIHADLEYTISALGDKGCPLNSETGDPYQDIYYIEKIIMEKQYNLKKTKNENTRRAS